MPPSEKLLQLKIYTKKFFELDPNEQSLIVRVNMSQCQKMIADDITKTLTFYCTEKLKLLNDYLEELKMRNPECFI